VTVGEYVISDMRNDEIVPDEPIYQKIIDEYMAHCHEEGFVAERFFVQHPDTEISRLAANLATDKYQLSRIFSKQAISENVVQEVDQQTDADRLPELTQRLLLELKYTVVNERIALLEKMLADAQTGGDWNTIRELLQQQPILHQLRTEICKALGNRVIVG